MADQRARSLLEGRDILFIDTGAGYALAAKVIGDIGLDQLAITGGANGDVVTLVGGVPTWQSQNAVQTIGTGGAAQTLDPNVYAAFLLTLTADITLTITAPTAPGQHTITIYTIQDGTGTWDITWPASVDWDNNTPPTPTLTAGTRSLYILTTLDGGTHWTGSMIGTALA